MRIFTQRFRVILIFLGVGVSLFFFSTTVAVEKLSMTAFDTVAGYPTQINARTVAPHEVVKFFVTAPDATVSSFTAEGSSDGTAVLLLDSLNTRMTGRYTVRAFTETANSDPATFSVYSGDVSSETSEVSLDTTTVRLDQKTTLSVVLKDAFGNPISSHEVQAISNKKEDLLTADNAFSDKNGLVSFQVSSSMEGVSTLTIEDVTAHVTLSTTPKILFGNTSLLLSDAGGDDAVLFAAVPDADPTVVDHFEIEGFPLYAQKNVPTSFTLKATNKAKDVIQNYFGTVHFSASGVNSGSIQLPQDYTFTVDDLGKHVFNQSVIFTQDGLYTLEVRDLKNTDLMGTVDVVVGQNGSSADSTATGSSTPSKDIVITSPVAGTFSTNVQTISGTVVPGLDVKIFDNSEEIGTVTADSKGSFTYTTSTLADGMHDFMVAMVDDQGVLLGNSEVVHVKIDTKAALIEHVVVDPSGEVPQGGLVNIQLTSEKSLQKVSMLIENTLFDLNSVPTSPGVYAGSFKAPMKAGNFPIDFVLKDQLGNEQLYKAQYNLAVGAAVGGTSGISDGLKVGITPPSQVTGLLAYPGENRVTLVWNPGLDDTGIGHYRVYYGLSPDSLIQIVETHDASTTWYIGNLKPGTQYYFGVTAVDLDNNESTGGSEVVSSSPLHGSAPIDTNGMSSVPGQSGPNLLVTLMLSGLGSLAYFRAKK